MIRVWRDSLNLTTLLLGPYVCIERWCTQQCSWYTTLSITITMSSTEAHCGLPWKLQFPWAFLEDRTHVHHRILPSLPTCKSAKCLESPTDGIFPEQASNHESILLRSLSQLIACQLSVGTVDNATIRIPNTLECHTPGVNVDHKKHLLHIGRDRVEVAHDPLIIAFTLPSQVVTSVNEAATLKIAKEARVNIFPTGIKENSRDIQVYTITLNVPTQARSHSS
mmetsp:Transcript_60929/g.114882  ORF Transcript_60929/g.114882 Transcript_60929/m.114882 type:complete len:223 (+) Transcript_60929:3-671(+)